MKIKGINEFDLIRKFTCGLGGDTAVIKGIGDDAAVIRSARNEYLIFTTDMIIEDVHFKIKATPAYAIGHKALAVNISDIAAMGGIPKYAVVSLGLPKSLSLKFALSLYRGIRKIAKAYNVKIVGGDTCASGKLIINIALLGVAKSKKIPLRSGAKVNDRIFVTGTLGGSRTRKHLTFQPKLKESRMLTSKFDIHSMIDISDGLASDLMKILKASGVGACLFKEKIPLSRHIKDVARALYDGEDFELLFTVSNKDAPRLKKMSSKNLRLKLTEIGVIVSKREGMIIVDKGGSRKKISLARTFTHF